MSWKYERLYALVSKLFIGIVFIGVVFIGIVFIGIVFIGIVFILHDCILLVQLEVSIPYDPKKGIPYFKML